MSRKWNYKSYRNNDKTAANRCNNKHLAQSCKK